MKRLIHILLIKGWLSSWYFSNLFLNLNFYILFQYFKENILKQKTHLKKLWNKRKNNPNSYLGKSLLTIQNFNPKKTEKNIQMASILNNDENLISTINSIKLITNFLNFKIRNLIKI